MTRTWTVGVDAGGSWIRVMATDDRGRRWTMKERASRDLGAMLRALWRRRRLRRAKVVHVVVAARGVWTAAERRAATRQLYGLGRRVSVLGPLFGDGGSAFALGRDWLAAADPSRARRLARLPDAVARIAALAPRVLRLARRGDGPARLAVARGSSALALGIRAAVHSARLAKPTTASWAGTLLDDRAYRALVWRSASGLGLSLAPMAPRASALEAAAQLAARGTAGASRGAPATTTARAR